MYRKLALALLWLALICVPLGVAQDNAAPNPAGAQVRFDIASIHPSRPEAGPRDGRFTYFADRLDLEAATVGDILDMLNNWQLLRVVGGPEWMRTDRYDIHAKSSVPIPAEQRQAAVLALLAERFKLVVHRETRAMPSMVMMAPKLPAGLKPAADGETYAIHFDAHGDPIFVAAPMSAVTNYLSQMLQAPVSDQTGLKGAFDFAIAPSQIDAQPGEVRGDRVRDALIAFGFKIDTKKIPTEITVVEHCERPSEN